MKKIILITWIFFTLSALLWLFMSVLTDKYQPRFFNAVRKKQQAPQERINRIFKQFEQDEAITIEKHTPNTKQKDADKYKRPKFIRDKHNPKILYPHK